MNEKGNHYSEKFSKTCAAVKYEKEAKCPLPSAVAYDHQDGYLKVQKEFFLVNLEGEKGPGRVAEIDWTKRSEYVIKYDARDGSGNDAEQVWFSLVLNDLTAPVLRPGIAGDLTLESCDRHNVGQLAPDKQRYWKLKSAVAVDNIDGDLTKDVQVSITTPGAGAPRKFRQAALAKDESLALFDTKILGNFKLQLSVHDHAGMFGQYGKGNVQSMITRITVQDSTPPKIYCKKNGCTMHKKIKMDGVLLNTATKILSFDKCCDACETQQWRRVLGSDEAKNKPACVFFHWSRKRESCTLFGNANETTKKIEDGMGHRRLAGLNTVALLDYNEKMASYTEQVAKTHSLARDSIIKDISGAPASELKERGITRNETTAEFVSESGDSEKLAVAGSVAADTQSGEPNTGCVGEDPFVQECGSAYTDPGARCIDMRDSLVGSTISESALASRLLTDARMVNSSHKGVYTVKYSCSDLSGLTATKTRTVKVKDLTPPIVGLVGEQTVQHFVNLDNQLLDALLVFKGVRATSSGYKCTEKCTGDLRHSAKIYPGNCPGVFECMSEDGVPITCNGGEAGRLVTLATIKSVPGTYGIKYSCSDTVGTVAKCRTVITQHASIDCRVSPWSVFGACSKSCGTAGMKTRTRSVTTATKYGGTLCPVLEESASCNSFACPTDCEVSGWSGYGACSKSCGTGTEMDIAHFTFDSKGNFNGAKNNVVAKIFGEEHADFNYIRTYIVGECRIQSYKGNMAWHVSNNNFGEADEGHHGCSISTVDMVHVPPVGYKSCKFSLSVTDLDYHNVEKEADDKLCFTIFDDTKKKIVERCQVDDIKRRRMIGAAKTTFMKTTSHIPGQNYRLGQDLTGEKTPDR
jgi:hypothetical protein